MNTLKVISALMCYPNEELVGYGESMIEVVRQEAVLPEPYQIKIFRLIEKICNDDLLDRQSEYVETFDRGRAVSLLLFEHVHGESRDRGQAMVDLMQVYADQDWEITANELPDYIPLFLEYLSTRPDNEVLEWLGNVQHILARIAARLEARDSLYNILFFSLLSLLEENMDIAEIRAEVSAEKRDDTPEELDKIWEEEAVRFGNENKAADRQQSSAREYSIPVESIKRI